jgi:3-phosphoglycerate kinase
MASKIFVRERRKIEEGEKKPRFRIVGVSGGDVKLYVKHMRKTELEQVSTESGAQIVYLEDKKDKTGKAK